MLIKVKPADNPRKRPSKKLPGKYQLKAIDNAKQRMPIGKRRSSLLRTNIITHWDMDIFLVIFITDKVRAVT
jgi:hypothetical protein